MPFSFALIGAELKCEGNGMELLKLKTALSKRLGHESVHSIDSKSFSLSLLAATAASNVFVDICGFVPTEIQEEERVFTAHESARKLAMAGVLENQITSLESPWDNVLDPAQAVAVSAMITNGLLGLCLFDEQGIGKTVMAMAAFDVLYQRGEIDSMMIICPVTMIGGWKGDVERFLPGKYKIGALTGSAEAKRKRIFESLDILICNYESVGSFLVPLKGVLGNKKTMLVADESFNVKNKDAMRSIAVRELRGSCAKGFVLCGTPAPNSPIDVINQFDIADGGYTFAGFHPSKDHDKLVEDISRLVDEKGTMIRRLKEEVLPSLPSKNFNVISVKMSGKQAALYEDARHKLELELKSMDNATFKKSLANYFQKRSVLLQLCACPEAIDPSYTDISAKITALDLIVQKIVEHEKKKLIIWSFYRASFRQLFERYKKHFPIVLSGDTSASERAEAVQAFQKDPNVRVCIANPAAAGAGITLHAASDAAYLSFSNQAAHFLQSIDRIHRRGQSALDTNYHIIVCDDTIEETEVRRLREKELHQHQLLGDKVKWPNSLDEALSELASIHS